MVVLRLPKYVLLPVLIDWISMVDLCRLDSAVSNNASRPVFLALIRSVAFTGLKDVICGDSYLLWLDLRQMSVTYVNYVINRNRTRERLSSCIGALYDALYGRKHVFPVNKKRVVTGSNEIRQHYLSKLRYLKLNIEAKLNERGLNQLSEHCHQLLELSVISNRANVFIGSHVFMNIIKQCQDLKELTLERCTMTMKSFNSIFQHCVNLKLVNFNSSTITDAETRHIHYNPNDNHYYTGVTTMNCCNLTNLSMSGVSVLAGGFHAHQTTGRAGIQMNPVGAAHGNAGGGGGRFRNRPDHNDELPELLFVTIIQNNPGLLYISMNYNQYCTNYTLSQIAQCCPKLISLDVCFSYNLNDEGVGLITEQCSTLQYINLIDCNITELSIYQVATRCLHLIYVEVQQLNDSEINILTLNCKQLQAFKLINNVLATSVGLMNIATRCIHLRELVYSAYTLLTDQITNATVITMASNCDQLRSFVCIQRWNAITDSSIQILAQKCSRLEKLVLTYNSILSDASVHALATYSRNLTHLDISNCEYITDSPVMRVSSCCPNLRVLDLYHCNDVSDLCIHHVITHSFRLAALTLPDTGVTEDILSEIGHYCNELRLLRVNQQFTASQILMLRRRRPNLVIKFGKDVAHVHKVYALNPHEN